MKEYLNVNTNEVKQVPFHKYYVDGHGLPHVQSDVDLTSMKMLIQGFSEIFYEDIIQSVKLNDEDDDFIDKSRLKSYHCKDCVFKTANYVTSGFSERIHDSLLNEMLMYSVCLQPIQGVYVPVMYQCKFSPLGRFESIVLSYEGEPIDSFYITETMKRQMYECVNACMKLKVYLDFESLDHFLYNEQTGKVCLINFGGAIQDFHRGMEEVDFEYLIHSHNEEFRFIDERNILFEPKSRKRNRSQEVIEILPNKRRRINI